MSYVMPVWLVALVLMAIVVGAIILGIALFFVIRYRKGK